MCVAMCFGGMWFGELLYRQVLALALVDRGLLLPRLLSKLHRRLVQILQPGRAKPAVTELAVILGNVTIIQRVVMKRKLEVGHLSSSLVETAIYMMGQRTLKKFRITAAIQLNMIVAEEVDTMHIIGTTMDLT